MRYEIATNTRDKFQVIIKDVDTAGGIQDILYTFEPDELGCLCISSKALGGKNYGLETCGAMALAQKIATADWVYLNSILNRSEAGR